jgi:hypothetical protein
VTKEPVEGTCPECDAAQLARYPVLSTGGWFMAVKCGRCLTTIERTPWNRLGSVDRDHADRVAGLERRAPS